MSNIKRIRKILSVLLVLSMLASVFSVSFKSAGHGFDLASGRPGNRNNNINGGSIFHELAAIKRLDKGGAYLIVPRQASSIKPATNAQAASSANEVEVAMMLRFPIGENP